MTNYQAFQRTTNKIRRAQEIMDGTLRPDGWPGTKTEQRYIELRTAALTNPDGEWLSAEEHKVMASSFADPADVRAFNRCKSSGNSDKYCFAFGDNGIGCWGDNTAQEQRAMVALPPDDMIEKWGSIDAAKHKIVIVTVNGKTINAILADRMPWRANLKTDAGLDLNPGACKQLNLRPPILVPATWKWA